MTLNDRNAPRYPQKVDLKSHGLPDAEQEAQLSQRGRAMVHVMEYFAKPLKDHLSLKVIRNNTIEYRACMSLLVFNNRSVAQQQNGLSIIE